MNDHRQRICSGLHSRENCSVLISLLQNKREHSSMANVADTDTHGQQKRKRRCKVVKWFVTCDPRHNSSNGQATQIRDQRRRWRKGVETLGIVCWALDWIHNHSVDSSFVISAYTLVCSLEYICGVDADECILLGKRIIVRVGTQHNHARICNIGYTWIFCVWRDFGETMRRMCTKISIALVHYETNLFLNHTVSSRISEWMKQRTSFIIIMINIERSTQSLNLWTRTQAGPNRATDGPGGRQATISERGHAEESNPNLALFYQYWNEHAVAESLNLDIIWTES